MSIFDNFFTFKRKSQTLRKFILAIIIDFSSHYINGKFHTINLSFCEYVLFGSLIGTAGNVKPQMQ